jgi:DeoR family transcriptional regulator, deoxyribose operon repressor
MPTKKRQDRIGKILETLHTTQGATIRELSESLGVSEMTVRRDLETLSTDRKVRLVHAGAIPFSQGGGAYSLVEHDGSGAAEKMRIGMKAASLIEAGDVVIIDSGSTAEWLARSIPADIPVTILCFALNIMLEAGKDKARTIVLAGGKLHAETLVFESPEGIGLIRRHRANKAFFTAGGASAKLGVTCTDSSEAELKKAAVASSHTRILLADSRKFGTVKPSWFADLADFDAVITDSGISLEYVEIMRDLGIALHVV